MADTSVSSPAPPFSPPAKLERRNSMQMVVEVVSEVPLDLVTRVGRFCSRTLLDMMLDANSGGIGLTLSNPERPELYWVVLGYYVLFFVANGILIWQLTISTVSSRFLSLGTSDGVTQVCAESAQGGDRDVSRGCLRSLGNRPLVSEKLVSVCSGIPRSVGWFR